MAIDPKHFFKKHPHICVFLLFIVAAIILTYPLVFQFSTHILSDADHDGDAPMFLWNMWWSTYALFDLHQNPYHATTILWPEEPSLAFHTLAPVNTILSLPFQLIGKPIVAFNITTLLIITLNGFCLYMLAWRLSRFRFGSIVAGMIFAFCPALTAWALGHYNLLAAWMMPLILLLLFSIRDKLMAEKVQPSKNRRPLFFSATILGLLLGAQYWNDLHYVVYIGIAILLFLLLFAKDFFNTSVLKVAFATMAITFVVFAIIILPLVCMQVRELSLNGSFEQQSFSMYEIFSPDLLRYAIPSPLNGLLKNIPLALAENMSLHGNPQMYILPVYISLSLLAFLVIGIYSLITQAKKITMLRYWLAVGVVFFILSLGPTLFIADRAFGRGLLPYAIFSEIPILNNIRVPSRMIIVVYLTCAVLSAFALQFLVQKKTRWRNVFIVGMLVLLAVEFFPIPRQTKKVLAPSIYEELRTPETGVIFEMPFGRADGFIGYGQFSSTLQSYQISHHRKVLLGIISRTSKNTLLAVSEIAELQYILHPTIAPLPDVSQTIYTVERLRDMGILEIVLHTAYFSDEKVNEIENYLMLFSDKITTTDGGKHRLYRIR